MAADLEKTIEGFKGKIYESNFDISTQFLPDDQIVKNIIASKSSYTKEDTEMMINGLMTKKLPKDINVPEKPDIKNKVESSGTSGTSGASGTSGTSGLADEKEGAKTKVKGVAAKAYPLPENSGLHQEAKQMKEEARIASTMLMKEKSSISQELANVTVLIANSVPAILGLTVTIPIPNIPTAIALACSIISLISKLVDKIQDVLNHLEPLKKLKLLISEENYKKATLPLNLALTALTKLLAPILKLKEFIQTLLGKITSLVNPNSIQSQLKSLQKELKKKKKEIEQAKKDKEPQSDIDMLEKEKKDIENQIKNLNDKAYQQNSDIAAVQKDIEDTLQTVNEVNQVTYVYDVKLPNGTVLTNQTD